jgi:hypothetical protein
LSCRHRARTETNRSRARSQGVNFLAFKWTSVDNNNMTSIVVGIPDAPTVVFEITSPNEPHILDVSTLPKVKPRFGSAIDQVMSAESRAPRVETRTRTPPPDAPLGPNDMTCHDITLRPQVRRSVP